MYGQGVSHEGCIVDIGTDMDIIEKSGAWYSYAGTRLGQGRENVKEFLRGNKNICAEIESKIREKLIVTDSGAEVVAEKAVINEEQDE